MVILVEILREEIELSWGEGRVGRKVGIFGGVCGGRVVLGLLGNVEY